MTVRVIDVSRHQGPIDWAAVKASGVRGAWIKVGGADGGYYRDSRAGENLAGAEAAGLPYGTYYFCVPDSDPRAQARHAVSCGHGRGVMWPSPDIEVNPNGLSPAAMDRWAVEFCDETMRLTGGRESVIYCGMGTVGHTADAPRYCPLWIANYGTNRPGTEPPAFNPRVPPAWSRWDAWQFNSTTRVPGIAGNTVDQNVVTDDLWARMTGAPTNLKELAMKAISIPNNAAMWLLVFDGFGRPRRYGMPNSGAGAAIGAAFVDGSVTLEGEAADWFMGLPESNPDHTADGGALALTMNVLARLEALSAQVAGIDPADIDEDTLAAKVAEFLADDALAPAIARATIDQLAGRLEG